MSFRFRGRSRCFLAAVFFRAYRNRVRLASDQCRSWIRRSVRRRPSILQTSGQPSAEILAIAGLLRFYYPVAA